MKKKVIFLLILFLLPVFVFAKASELSFTDVSPKAWYYKYVKEAYNKGIIAGYSKTIFAPQAKITRGQLVTILWRYEGEPSMDNVHNRFSDVKEGEYYTDGVKWAASKGIVSGYGGTSKFGPGNPIIRQDLALILKNYAEYKRKDTTANTDLSNFVDYNKLKNSYALDALKWAVKYKVISGNDLGKGKKSIDPLGNATRAHAATMIVNFIDKIEDMPSTVEEPDEVTDGMKAALEAAMNYLDGDGYSRQMLIEYLEDDGYSNEEAIYAVDHCDTSWKFQAIRTAQNALERYYFSSAKLAVHLVEDEKYTEEEATYAVNNCGADYNVEAKEAAQYYIDEHAISYEMVKSSLMTDEEFTESETLYGINHSTVNWSQEAEQAARECLSEFPNSYKRVKRILIDSYLFTDAQATSGLTSANIDWKEQAYKSLKRVWTDSMTSEEGIEYLETRGFTHEEAEYAVERIESE